MCKACKDQRTYTETNPAIVEMMLGKTGEDTDPNGINQHEPGAKFDSGKILAGILSDFSRALKAVAAVGTFGANKYSRGGWQSVPNGTVRYYDALWRHLLEESIDAHDNESEMLHAAHLAWNSLARLELLLREGLELTK